MKRMLIVGRNYKQWILAAALLLAPAAARAAQWPNTVASSLNLYTAVNNCYTNLTSSMTISQTTATVSATTCFPSSGLISAGAEVMAYTSKDSTHFYALTRAYDGTSAAAYPAAMPIRMNIVAKYHNALADELTAMSSTFFLGSLIHIDTASARMGFGTIYLSSTGAQGSPTFLIYPNGGGDQTGMTLMGQYFPGATRTAIDIYPPIQFDGSGVTEITLYGEWSTPLSTYSRVNFGKSSFLNDVYSLGTEESSGTSKSRSLVIGMADHGNGVNRASIYIPGNNVPSQGQFGSVQIGSFAQMTNQTVTDNRPINALVVRTPDMETAGFKDSHAFSLVGVSSDSNGAHRIYWQHHVEALSNAGASGYVLGHQVIPGGTLTTDNGPTALSTAIYITDGNFVFVSSGVVIGTTTTSLGSERLHVIGTSYFEEVSGTSNTYNSSWGLQLASPVRSITGGNANLAIAGTNAQGVDGGGTIGLGGRYIDSNNTPILFGIIGGRKETGTSNLNSGYINFVTPSNNTYAEQMRISSTGTVTMTGTGAAVTFTALTSTPTAGSTKASIWAVNVGGSAEMKVVDGAGNITQISPHNSDGDWIFNSYNEKTGRRIYYNMSNLLQFLVIGLVISLAMNLLNIFVFIRMKRGR